jgi:DNA-binding HxlR family transcriptional regulator
VGGRWKGLVIWNLREGSRRFSELRRILVAVNDKMLTQVLRGLEGDGVIHRRVCQVVPPKVEYSLTEEGRTLLPIMSLMSQYGSKYRVQ